MTALRGPIPKLQASQCPLWSPMILSRSLHSSLWCSNLNLGAHLQRIPICNSRFFLRCVTRLRLFPFSLKYKASAWLHSLPSGSITTWDELTKVFHAKFFPSSETASLRNQITSFTQREDKSLYEAWERFKNLLRLCPHDGLHGG